MYYTCTCSISIAIAVGMQVYECVCVAIGGNGKTVRHGTNNHLMYVPLAECTISITEVVCSQRVAGSVAAKRICLGEWMWASAVTRVDVQRAKKSVLKRVR